MATDKDEKELEFNVDRDVTVRKKKDEILTFMYVTAALVIILGIMSWAMYSLFADVKKAQVEMAQAKQLIYTMAKNQERQSRRSIAIEDTGKVILFYNPSLSTFDWLVDLMAATIYDIGELKYNIPYEESILFFALESRFHRTAVSKLGAKGPGQLMEDTARWAAIELSIPWEGDATLFDMIKNIKMSLFVYKKYRERFNYEFEYYLAAYFWGPTTIGTFYDNNQKLKGKYTTYRRDWKKIKVEVEGVLGRKITVAGDNE